MIQISATPKISIITVSLNQRDFIEENILSVKTQKYPNVEHLIIDGGSVDGTLDILEKYGRDITWISEPDNGQSDALNKGFKKATGDIIGWINSDDKLHPNALSIVAEYFRANIDSIGVVGDLAIIDETSKVLEVIKSSSYNKNYLVNIAKGITQPSTFFKRSVFGKVGYIDESLEYVMDRDLFIRIASIRQIDYIPTTLAEFRIQPDSKTAKGSYYFSKELIKVRKKYGGKILSPGMRTDLYIILTEPLRRIPLLRKAVKNLKAYGFRK